METTPLAWPHPIGHFCPNGRTQEPDSFGKRKRQCQTNLDRFYQRISTSSTDNGRQWRQAANSSIGFSIWIQPSEAEGAGGLAVLRYSALLVNKCLIEQ